MQGVLILYITLILYVTLMGSSAESGIVFRENRCEWAFKSLHTELASVRTRVQCPFEITKYRLEMIPVCRAEEFFLLGQRQLPKRREGEWLNLTGLGALPASRSRGEEDKKTRAWTSMGH